MIIAYLYYDLLNLYGTSGNVSVLKKCIEETGKKAEVKLLSLEDKLEFDKYDIVYIGSGTEDNLMLALNHLKPYAKDIKKAIEGNKTFLITGNSLELFGERIDETDALGIFNYFSYSISKHKACESVMSADFIDEDIIGFQNRLSFTAHMKSNLFKVISGFGHDVGSNKEGLRYKNFYATYLLGPLLARNPKFLTYFMNELGINSKLKLKLETDAYDNYIKKYKKNKD